MGFSALRVSVPIITYLTLNLSIELTNSAAQKNNTAQIF